MKRRYDPDMRIYECRCCWKQGYSARICGCSDFFCEQTRKCVSHCAELAARAEHSCSQQTGVYPRTFVPVTPIDGHAAWYFAGGQLQREAPGQGRYRVFDKYVSRATGESVGLDYWLRADADDVSHEHWLAIREIVNSNQPPDHFRGGLELPTRVPMASAPANTNADEVIL